MSAIRCRPDSPLRCDHRAAAMARQDFAYVWGWGWVWWKAANPTRAWTTCPWCEGELPDMAERATPATGAIEPLDSQRQADGADFTDFAGEDGG